MNRPDMPSISAPELDHYEVPQDEAVDGGYGPGWIVLFVLVGILALAVLSYAW